MKVDSKEPSRSGIGFRHLRHLRSVVAEGDSPVHCPDSDFPVFTSSRQELGVGEGARKVVGCSSPKSPSAGGGGNGTRVVVLVRA